MDNRVKNRRRRRFLQLGVTTAAWLCSSVIGCTNAPSPAATMAAATTPTQEIDVADALSGNNASQGTLLRLAMSSLPNTFIPPLFTTPGGYVSGFLLYDSLIWIDHALTPQPLLAEKWESMPSGQQWIFHLRRDVTFHHGTPFTAQDVVYTFQNLFNPTLKSPQAPVLSFIKEVKAIDDYTVRFVLDKPNVDLPLLVGSPQTCIIPHDLTIKQLAVQPSGTGPFRFETLLPGERVTYTRNADYWAAERITVTDLHQIHIGSFADQVTALQQGKVDLLAEVDLDLLEQLNKDPNIQVLEAASGRYQVLAMQVKDSPFEDVRVRQAIKAALDRTSLQQQILKGYGEPGYDHPVATISPFFADLPPKTQDFAKVRQLLADAGYPNGLQLQLITANAIPGMVKLAYAVQEMVQSAGIQIDVVEVQVSGDIYFSSYWSRPPFYVSVWEFRPSIYETFAIGYHSSSLWNETGWTSPDLDKLLDAARRERDLEKRRELYKAAEQLLSEEGAVVIPYFQPVLTATSSRVRGFTPHPAGWVDLRDVKIT